MKMLVKSLFLLWNNGIEEEIMLKITTRIFAAGVLAATLASTNLSAFACESCMEGAKPMSAKPIAAKAGAVKSATVKSVTKVALKSNVRVAKMVAKTSANAKLTPKTTAKMTSLQTGAKKTAAAPMCPNCVHGDVPGSAQDKL